MTIPAEYRFRSSEVSIRRDPGTGDIILSEGPGSWADVFAALDAAGVPEDFLAEAERAKKPPVRRTAVEELLNDDSMAGQSHS